MGIGWLFHCRLHCLGHAEFSHSAMLGVGVVGEWMDADASAWGEESFHLDVAWIHKPHEVVEDYVDTVFVEIPVVSEREQIEFQTFTLHHTLTRDVLYHDFGEVGLAGFRAERGKLRAVERHEIFALGMLVDECLEQFGRIVRRVFRALVAK